MYKIFSTQTETQKKIMKNLHLKHKHRSENLTYLMPVKIYVTTCLIRYWICINAYYYLSKAMKKVLLFKQS